MKRFPPTATTLFVAAATAVTLVAGASAAAGTAAATASTHVDQVTMDFNNSRNGVQLEINASNVTSTSSGVTTVSSIAVASLQDIEGTSGIGIGDCYPAGNAFPDQTLPPGALVFGPSPQQASLHASFTCTRTSDGSQFPLTVDLHWAATTAIAHGGWQNSQWHASLSGTASDGTTDYNNPAKTGIINHQTS